MKKLFIPTLSAGLAILLFCRTCPAEQSRHLSPAPYKDAVRCGIISSPELREISGLAVSRKTPGLLWAINDGRNPPVVYGLSTKGVLLKTYKVGGAKNRDWEDLAGFRYRDADFLVIADVGDNFSKRSFNTLYCVKEPAPGRQRNGVLQLEWEMKFKYQNGPLDCEAVAVDATNQKIYLLSKRNAIPVLYELPLDMPCKKSMYTAKAVAKLRNIPEPTPEDQKQTYGKYYSRPTAMDISADGNILYILTYKHAYVYSRTPDQTWDLAFLKPPQQITLPDPSHTMVQREALGLDQKNGYIFITSEKALAPIYMIEPIFPPAN